ncbi:hypothetical protein [Neobacillus drentensis]|uniref:hypothetical protein n=1 Tax=Neobacillus drentensis TaxID=220684 RepID=UPI002FFF1D9C
MSFDWLQERDLLGGEESLFFMIYITPSFGKADSESINHHLQLRFDAIQQVEGDEIYFMVRLNYFVPTKFATGY